MAYQFMKILLIALFKTFKRFQVIGAENVPKTGPVILVSNHVSFWDPFVIGAASPRQISYLAKESLFKIPLVGLLIKCWGAIPVKRGHTDRDSFNKYLELLKQGNTLGIFIEGTRNRKNPDQMLPPKSGPSMLAVRSKAPVVPLLLINSSKILTFRRLIVIIGPPLQLEYDSKLDKKDLYQHLSNQMATAIMKLKELGRV